MLEWIKEKIHEIRVERRARKKLKRIEEEEKIHRLAEKYHRKGLMREEARILAEKEVRGRKGSLLDSFLKSLESSSSGRTRKSRRDRSIDIFAEFDRYLKDLDRNIKI